MPDPFLGEISIFSFNFAPKGWAMCNGQLLPINQNQALFSLLGTTFGGDGRTTFGLPNLQGRTPVHPDGSSVIQGQAAGEQAVTLTLTQLATHTHSAIASSNNADQSSPANNFWAKGQQVYSNTSNAQMAAQAVLPIGGGQAHQNMSPYLTVTFCIALQGIFPTPN